MYSMRYALRCGVASSWVVLASERSTAERGPPLRV